MNKKKRTIYHTSPEEINEINEMGRFGSSLFFSDKPYYMSVNDPITYEMDLDDDDVLDINELPYLDEDKIKKIHPFLKQIEKMTGVTEDEALDLLSERTNIHNFFSQLEDYANFYYEQDKSSEEKKRKLEIFKKLSNKDLGEISWNIQSLGAKAAKALGYKGAKLYDEQGTSYLIDMLGREKELKKSK